MCDIYIPICFYYFASGLQTVDYASGIYIPICFYYFKYADCDDDEIAIFTFQYVSIISYVAEVGGCFAHNLHSNMFLLFHNQERVTADRRCNLHSNMFLLFPPRRWITAAVKEHLHSNMFLLFRNFSSFKSPTNTHLHSNMFLLFRATAASSLAAFNSFTFQYVSIIS